MVYKSRLRRGAGGQIGISFSDNRERVYYGREKGLGELMSVPNREKILFGQSYGEGSGS